MPSAPLAGDDSAPRLPFRVGLAVVCVAAAVAAVGLFRQHGETSRGLWLSPSHDRNANYCFAHELAADVRAGDLRRLAEDFDRGSWTWPPLHGLLLAAVLLVGGNDPVLAVLPSTAAWAVGAVFAYLAAARAVPRFGPLAGGVAAAFVLGNPTFRASAADCMLESLGGCLTFAALFAYLRWEQDRTRPAAVAFGLALTLLFFHKYNYWLLVVLGCGLAHLVVNRGEVRAALKRLAGLSWRGWLSAQFRRPLNYPIALLAGVCVSVWLTGGYDLTVGGRTIPVRGTGVLVTVTYALALLRVTIWWWTGGRHAVRAWAGEWRYPLAYWHLTPVAVWFLIPLRIPKFVWFLSPANAPKEHPQLADSVQFYWQVFGTDYAAGEVFRWAVLALAGVAAVGVFVRGSYRPAGWVVPVYAAVTVALTVKHPNQYPRYFYTAAAGLWLSAAVGAALLAAFLARWHRIAGVVVPVLLLLLAVWCVAPHLLPGSREPAADPHSLRDLTDVVIRETTPDDATAVFGSHASKFWAKWAWLEAGRPAGRLQVDYREAGPHAPATEAERGDLFARWCGTTRCDVLVFVDIEPGSPLDEPTVPSEGHAALRELLPGQTTFTLTKTVPVPGRGTVAVWRRTSPGR